MKRQTDFVRVKPDDIIITDIREDKEKPGVQFNMYVRFSGAQQGMVTSVLPIAIIEAAIQVLKGNKMLHNYVCMITRNAMEPTQGRIG